MNSSRNHGLDTLRALAIVLVVLHHYVLFVSHRSTFGWVGDIGWVGVDLFFALSGYLIGNQIFAGMRSERPFSLPRFYARRLLRTLPNFYVVLALYYCWPWFRAGAELPPLWKFLTFTQNIHLQPGTAFSHAWSLCIEEQFYVVLPALALLIAAARHSLRWTLATLVLAVGGGMTARYLVLQDVGGGGNLYFKFIYYSTICRLDELIAGVVLALLKNYHAALWTRLTAHGNAVLALGCTLTAITFYLFLQDRYGVGMTVFGYPLLALSFALLILAALSERSILRSVRVPGAASIALWSYAIYLTHKQLLILAREPLERLGHGPESALAIAAMVVISVGSGWILYRCVERPFMALREKTVPTNFAAQAATLR
jgi:peptidoglycan/LPS O-acetylase OafA/YrhL